MTIALAEEASRRGLFPIILTRGYRGKGACPCFVTPLLKQVSEKPKSLDLCNSTYEAGDEPILLALRLPNVPVVRHSNRYEGGMFAIENLRLFLQMKGISNPSADRIVFLLDDGFQHWQLQRDTDVLLIDGSNPFGNGMLLPLGRLREPLKALNRCHVLVITRQTNKDAEAEIRRHNKQAPIFYASFKPKGIISMKGTAEPCGIIEDKKVFAFAGIGNPESFLRTIESLHPACIHFKALRDHHKYSTSDLTEILLKAKQRGTDIILTTEKDIVKLRELNRDIDNIYALGIDMLLDNSFYELIYRQ